MKTEQEDEGSTSESGTDTPETETTIDTNEETEDDEERIVREVDVTLDLTELQGANASLVDSFEVPNGTYTKVFLEVSRVNATLKNGE